MDVHTDLPIEVEAAMGGCASGTGLLSSAEMSRLMRALRTLRAVNRVLLHGGDEEVLLREICRIVVEDSGYRLAWVSHAEHDSRKSIRPLAFAGYEQGWLKTLRNTWADTERGRGPTGTAIRTGQPQVVRDVLVDPNYAPWREDARKRGYASVASLPLRVDGKLFGALTIYASEADAFDEEELNLLLQTAEDLGFGLGVLRTRRQARIAEDTIREMAYHDCQTGLPNRAMLRHLLDGAVADARRHNRALSLLVLGIGKFNEINETLGYREGDKVLREVAARIRGAIGGHDTLARIAENVFAVLLPDGGADHATRVAGAVLSVLSERIHLAGFQLEPRISIGIALFPGHGTDADTLIRCGNMALFQAERARAGYSIYTDAFARDIGRHVMLMGGLQHAIDNDELRLYCQPKVSIGSCSVCGAEALVRWLHPDRGMIVPTEFVKLAERSGLITPLTHWVLEAALRQLHAWRESGTPAWPIAVNLSACDLSDPRLIDHVQGSFATWGASPDEIQFELTESSLMENPNGALNALGRLKDLGVRLAIDDFGTGYSSLSYLQRLPVDAIKIDQSFVANVATSREAVTIVRAAIELAHNLNLEVVAEGVESEAAWRRLALLGCDVAQGFWIGRPMPIAEFGAWQVGSPWLLPPPPQRQLQLELQ